MVQKLLIVPLGCFWTRDHSGLAVASPQGEECIKAALDRGINKELHNYDVMYGALPGTAPSAKDGGINLGDVIARTFMKYGVPSKRIVRGGRHVWETHAEVSEGLRLGEEMHRGVIFVTSQYHVPRLRLVCVDILGFRTMKHMEISDMLEIRGCGNKHVTRRDYITEPVKYVAQALRIPFGSVMPTTLRGRL